MALSEKHTGEVQGSSMDAHPSPDWLAGSPLFGGVPAEARLHFAQQMERIEIGAGEAIYFEGEPAQSLFVVGEGKLEVLKTDHGAEHSLAELNTGDFFGDLSFIDMQTRSATVRALRPTVLWELHYSGLRAVYERDIKAYTLIVMNMAREISRRLRRADRRIPDAVALRPANRTGNTRRATLQVITELGKRRQVETDSVPPPALAVASGGYSLADD